MTDSESEAQGTILAVDDEPSLRAIISEVATLLDYRVLTAENGSEGLKLLEENHVDAIFSDINMPEMDGFEFFNRARQLKKVPFIFITGFSKHFEDAEKLRSEDNVYLFEKPFDISEIMGVLEKLEAG